MKRFTDTNKWWDAWFMDLPPKLKVVWLYLVDNCDHAGIIDVNIRLISYSISAPVTHDEILTAMGGRVVEFKPGKWLIKPFIKFQYGIELNPENSAHKGVIKRLAEYGLECPVTIKSHAPAKGLDRGYQAPKDKDKDKDTDQDKDKDLFGEQIDGQIMRIPPDPLDALNYGQSIGMMEDDVNAFLDHHAANGWKLKAGKMKDWKAALRTWKRNGETFNGKGRNGNGHALPSGAQLISWNQELKRVQDKMDRIVSQYGDHQAWDQQDKARFTELGIRKRELKNLIGAKE